METAYSIADGEACRAHYSVDMTNTNIYCILQYFSCKSNHSFYLLTGESVPEGRHESVAVGHQVDLIGDHRVGFHHGTLRQGRALPSPAVDTVAVGTAVGVHPPVLASASGRVRRRLRAGGMGIPAEEQATPLKPEQMTAADDRQWRRAVSSGRDDTSPQSGAAVRSCDRGGGSAVYRPLRVFVQSGRAIGAVGSRGRLGDTDEHGNGPHQASPSASCRLALRGALGVGGDHRSGRLGVDWLRMDDFDFWSGAEVRFIQPYQAVKDYRCPNCDRVLPVGVGHYVVVPVGAPDLRRHWHRGCWAGQGQARSAALTGRVPRRRIR